MQLSNDIADLLAQKIREMEQNSAEGAEKENKAQKAKMKSAAKTKIKEAKTLVNNADVENKDKIKKLWASLQNEQGEAETNTQSALKVHEGITTTERERNVSRGDLNRTHGVKNKLESLCRQLQHQVDTLVQEGRRLTDQERLRRQELADEFQHTIGDVKTKMDQQAQERARLARENEELRNRFKQFFEQYDTREKELLEQQRTRELEVQTFETKLAEQAQNYRLEAAREAAARRENEELTSTEQGLRGQLQTYSSKFSNFQDALSKSDKVLGQYRRQKNKMQRRVEVLEKENVELRTRNEKRLNQVTKERDSLVKAKESMQERCKSLQSERLQLVEKQKAAEEGKS